MYTGMSFTKQKPQSGFSMLEVLITILVVSFGLLGLAGLQAVGLKNNQTAYMRAVATQQAYDLADRMRSNYSGVATGYYDNLSSTGSNPGCISSGCTPSQMATYDFYIWNTKNGTLLPGGSGSVTRAKSAACTTAVAIAASDQFCIRVSWTEKCTVGETGCASDGTVSQNFDAWVTP